jgi:peptidoglycan-associated lipoprotein
MKVRSVLAVLASVALLAACNKDQPPKSPADPSAQGTGTGEGTGAPSAAAESPGIQTTSLNVSEDIVRLCNLPQSKSETNFAFDSSKIAEDDRELLSALAKCLSEGPLKGRKLSLIGRADPRGEDEYNMALGGARADSVRRYLKDLGVEETRMGSTSRGKLDASGKDEAGWAKDRRVDILLSN